ncbi:hypothetical protein BV898_19059 [Hypsibius exemplaris]|uniref:G-protein coupled receptors family 1 profile domain-containing protein n=1 Tax=Hypsibius exemplaris TaxID=2072580 RepID=A0A9X6NI04_HYPEX|nr:hypothetical protein BV898_19059 [Hypsibius exemplaris]
MENLTNTFPWLNVSASINSTLIVTVNLADPITTWFTIITLSATLFTNGLIVIVYAINSPLRTPFNAYIVNIAVTEIIQVNVLVN